MPDPESGRISGPRTSFRELQVEREACKMSLAGIILNIYVLSYETRDYDQPPMQENDRS